MNNGTITKFRIVAGAVIGLAVIGGGIYLLSNGIQVPGEFWALGAAALVAVVGIDLAASVVKAVRK